MRRIQPGYNASENIHGVVRSKNQHGQHLEHNDHVYVGEGLLDLMTSEDQLAVEFAHQVENIDHYHCAEGVKIRSATSQSEAW